MATIDMQAAGASVVPGCGLHQTRPVSIKTSVYMTTSLASISLDNFASCQCSHLTLEGFAATSSAPDSGIQSSMELLQALIGAKPFDTRLCQTFCVLFPSFSSQTFNQSGDAVTTSVTSLLQQASKLAQL